MYTSCSSRLFKKVLKTARISEKYTAQYLNRASANHAQPDRRLERLQSAMPLYVPREIKKPLRDSTQASSASSLSPTRVEVFAKKSNALVFKQKPRSYAVTRFFIKTPPNFNIPSKFCNRTQIYLLLVVVLAQIFNIQVHLLPISQKSQSLKDNSFVTQVNYFCSIIEAAGIFARCHIREFKAPKPDL